jgi:XTP/dITP diphosphohydrolase
MKLIFATSNRNKAQEIADLLPESIEIITLADLDINDDIPETADTLEGNAHLKASFISEKFKLPCFADDTGLEIEALNQRPGVFSARYAGPQRDDQDNMNKVLEELTKHDNRAARFRTVIALHMNGEKWTFEGIVNGRILTHQQGTQGFGYDPIFAPETSDRSFAEMSVSEKNSISHRGKAIKKLVEFLRQLDSI